MDPTTLGLMGGVLALLITATVNEQVLASPLLKPKVWDTLSPATLRSPSLRLLIPLLYPVLH